MTTAHRTDARSWEPRAEPAFTEAAVLDQIGLATSSASGPVGWWLARHLGLEALVIARLKIVAADPGNPMSATRWYRTFGSTTTVTTMSVEPTGEIVERVGPLMLRFSADVDSMDGTLRLSLAGARIGPVDVTRCLPIAITVEVSARTALRNTTVDIDVGRFGRLRYVATMSTSDQTIGAMQ